VNRYHRAVFLTTPRFRKDKEDGIVMKIASDITVLSPAAAQVSERTEAQKDRKSQSGGQTIFAGNLQGDFSLQERIQLKKEQAQKRALKVINDAWNGDRKIAEEIEDRRTQIEALRQENKDAQGEIFEMDGRIEELRTVYGVEEDSQEQQELELLKKEQESRKPVLGVELTDEEEEQLTQIHKKGLTEYQSRALEMNQVSVDYKETIARNKLKIMGENQEVRSIREERRKVHPMLDAQDEAEDIMGAVRDEIVNMVVEDSKEHLDEEEEKREEEAEEIKEEKEKQEELVEKREEREDVLEELMSEMPVEQMMDMDQTLSEVKRQIQNILNEMNLAVEDIKGSQVDTSV